MTKPKHAIKQPIKNAYYYGIELIECECGVWRVHDDAPGSPDYIGCWNGTDRKQTTAEAFVQLNQAFRNLGYQILRGIRLIK